MDTACLKIKFTSLITKLHKDDSKCYLEIVPEVASIKNLDKILWKQENNFQEYIIPMNYKIILKKGKKSEPNGTDYESNQIYHSCVDLLHTTTTSSVDAFGDVGDIHRIFSETVLLNKVTANIHSCMIIPRPRDMCSNLENKNTASAQTYEKRGEFTLTSINNNNMDQSKNTNFRTNHGNNCVTRNIEIQVDSMENIINIVKDLVENGIQKRINQRTDLIVNPISIMSNVNAKRILSLAPMCSINTDDTIKAAHTENCYNPSTLMKYGQKACYDNVVPYNYLSPIVRQNVDAAYMFNNFNSVKPYRQRYTPEVRIANFLKLIEDEILPLTCMLNDIVSKYTSLKIDNEVRDTLIEKKYSSQSQCKLINQQRSNRVIYTIVFDG